MIAKRAPVVVPCGAVYASGAPPVLVCRLERGHDGAHATGQGAAWFDAPAPRSAD